MGASRYEKGHANGISLMAGRGYSRSHDEEILQITTLGVPPLSIIPLVFFSSSSPSSSYNYPQLSDVTKKIVPLPASQQPLDNRSHSTKQQSHEPPWRQLHSSSRTEATAMALAQKKTRPSRTSRASTPHHRSRPCRTRPASPRTTTTLFP
jgi:hypothetical protein